MLQFATRAAEEHNKAEGRYASTRPDVVRIVHLRCLGSKPPREPNLSRQTLI